MDREPEELHSRGRSLNEKDLHDNLAYFYVPQAGIESIRSKLAFKIFDEYENILKGMYSTRFDSMGVQKIMTPMTRWTLPQADPCPLSLPLSKLCSLITKGEGEEGGWLASTYIIAYI